MSKRCYPVKNLRFRGPVVAGVQSYGLLTVHIVVIGIFYMFARLPKIGDKINRTKHKETLATSTFVIQRTFPYFTNESIACSTIYVIP